MILKTLRFLSNIVHWIAYAIIIIFDKCEKISWTMRIGFSMKIYMIFTMIWTFINNGMWCKHWISLWCPTLICFSVKRGDSVLAGHNCKRSKNIYFRIPWYNLNWTKTYKNRLLQSKTMQLQNRDHIWNHHNLRFWRVKTYLIISVPTYN